MEIPPGRTEHSSMPHLQLGSCLHFFRLKERVWRHMTNWTFRSSVLFSIVLHYTFDLCNAHLFVVTYCAVVYCVVR